MANPKQVGFNKAGGSKKVSRDLTYQHTFKNIIPGDVCIALEHTLEQLKLEFDEITHVKERMFGDPVEIPFIRYQADDGTEVPFGSYYVKGIGEIHPTYDAYPTPQIIIEGNLESKSHQTKAKWDELIALTAERAKHVSIFRGKAIKVLNPHDLLVPSYMDLTDDVEIFLNADLEDKLETCLFWPLMNRDSVRELGMPSKFGVILEGYYGAGKSLLLYKAARVAYASGWGVLHVGPGMVNVAMLVGKLLEPVCILVEDIDLSTHGDRDSLTALINSISSVTTKANQDYAIVVSTNFIDRIDPALLRPDRFDRLIKIELPDQDTVTRMLKATAGNVLGDATAAVPELVDKTPAIVAEIIKRCKIDVKRKGGKITAEMIISHLKSMQRQVELAMPEYRKGTSADRLYDELVAATNQS